MSSSKLVWSMVLGAALVAVGCERESETPSGAPAPVPEATEKASDDMQAKTEDASERAKSAADPAGDAAQKQAENASDALKKGSDAAAEAVAADPKFATEAKQIEQVMTYIREKKWDLAESTLKTLETNKAKLPAAMQAQVGNARTMLDAAKKGLATTNPAAAK
jgi:hypothetical protein